MDDRLTPKSSNLHSSIRAICCGLAAFPLLLGCGGGGGKEFPLAVGRSWSYMVDSGMNVNHVEDVKVLRQVPVGDVNGFELGGPMGQSRIGWKDGVLIAQQLPNASFNPPIPLLVAGADKASRTWRGMIGAGGRGSQATAVLEQEPAKEFFSGQTVQTTKSTLTIQSGVHRIELITWFQKGQGPIRQEQRNDGRLEVKFDAIAP